MVGTTFSSGADPVGATNNQGGFSATLVNNSMTNFTTTLQVNAMDVNGVQVDCTIGGVSTTNTTIPRIAGEISQCFYTFILCCMCFGCLNIQRMLV